MTLVSVGQENRRNWLVRLILYGGIVDDLANRPTIGGSGEGRMMLKGLFEKTGFGKL